MRNQGAGASAYQELDRARAAELPQESLGVVIHDGPLPPIGAPSLTSAERGFRAAIAGVMVGDRLETKPEFARWCSSVRAAHARRVRS